LISNRTVQFFNNLHPKGSAALTLLSAVALIVQQRSLKQASILLKDLMAERAIVSQQETFASQ